MWEGKEPQEKGCVASAAKEEKKKQSGSTETTRGKRKAQETGLHLRCGPGDFTV